MTLSGVASGGMLSFDYGGATLSIYMDPGSGPDADAAEFDSHMTGMAGWINSTFSLAGIDAMASWDTATATLNFVSGTGDTSHVVSNVVDGSGLGVVLNAPTTSSPDPGRIDLYGHEVVSGAVYAVTIGGTPFSHVALAGNDVNEVVDALVAAIGADPISAGWAQLSAQQAADPTDPGQRASILITADGPYALSVNATVPAPEAPPPISPTVGLDGLALFDMTNAASRTAALTDIEAFIKTAVDAASVLGAQQSRIAMQTEAVTKFSASVTLGIGALVDADMEVSVARMRALSVQQQLAVEALSIANQRPSNVLALFRR